MPEVRKEELPVLAIDLGGTKILTAIISDEGQMLAREYTPTLASEGPRPVIERLLSAVEHVLSLKKLSPSQIGAISIAAAGPLDVEKGLVTASPNLPLPIARI